MAMNCPPDLATIILDILAQGILTARAAAWAGDSDRCALETDHIHNLPSLLQNYSPDLLKYYWNTQRRTYLAACSTETVGAWEPLWARLRACAGGLLEPMPLT
jgi:hypothetical protein